MAMMAMTTSNSMSVNARRPRLAKVAIAELFMPFRMSVRPGRVENCFGRFYMERGKKLPERGGAAIMGSDE